MLRCTLGRSLGSSTATGLRYSSTAVARRSTRQLLRDLDQLLQEHSVVDKTWSERIQRAIVDLERTRPASLSIVGDRSAGVQKLTTAILDDPLSNSNPQDVTVALEARTLHQPPPEATQLRYGEAVENSEDELRIPAKWLQEHNTAITEIVHGDVPLESSFSTLHLSDAVLVLVSSTTLLSSRAAQTLLLNLHTKPNLIVCVNTQDASLSSSSSILETLQHQLDTLFPSSSSAQNSPIVMALSTEQAIEALSTLTPTTTIEGEPTLASTSYEDFQRGYLASQLPKLKTILSKILASHSSTSAPTPLQEETASYVLDSALSRAAFSAASLQDTLTTAQASLLALSEQTTESSQRLLTHSLGIDPKTGMFPLPSSELLASRQAIEEVFNSRLQFYKLPFNKIDDVSAELSLAISQSYLNDFEKHLLFSTGLFSSHSHQLSPNLSQFLSKPPFSSTTSSTSTSSSSSTPLSSSSSSLLYSPILENELSKTLHPHPTSPSSIPPTSLSTPLSSRRSQLLSSPISTLHRQIQSSLTSSLSISLATISSSIGLGFLESIQVGNAIGFGLLGSTFAVWKFQRGYEKAKGKFWREFERVSGGVSEDLGVVAKQLIERCEYPTRLAIRGYEGKVREKQVQVDRLREGLQAIARESKNVTVVKGVEENQSAKE